MPLRHPTLLSSEQRLLFSQIPDDLPDRDIARHYTLSDEDLAVIARQHGARNRLGFAVQLCVLRYPGRPLADLLDIPLPVLTYIAEQVGIPSEAFTAYGERENTVYEHLDRIRRIFGFHNYGWSEMLAVARHLLPQALENHRRLPLIESALAFMRRRQIVAPAMTTVEQLVWVVGRIARRRVTHWLTEDLSAEQCDRLNSLLQAALELSGRTRLAWLRAAPAAPSARHLHQLLDRLLFVTALRMPPISPRLHPARLRDLTQRCSRYPAQALVRLRHPGWRHALLRAHVEELGFTLCDEALDMFDRFHGDLLRQGERQQEHTILRTARDIHRDLHILTAAVEAFLRARLEDLNPFDTVFAAVDEDTLSATVASVRLGARPSDLDYLDLIEQRYVRRRQALLRLYRSLRFQAVRGHDPALDALEHVWLLDAYGQRVRAVEQQVEGRVVRAPLEHLGRTRWRRHAVHYSHVNPNYYEMAAFDRLRAGLRSGDIIVAGSRRYRDFESYLIPRPQWQEMQAAGQTRLAVTGGAADYLEEKRLETESSAARLLAELPGNASLSVDKDGFLKLDPLEKASPPEAEVWRRRLYDLLPRMQLPDLIVEVDAWTGFLDRLVHLGSGEPISRERKLVLVAAIMALGMNIGLEKMAQATAFTYNDLSWAEAWFVREETLTPALAALDNFALPQPLSQVWGGGTTSSSDAIRIPVGVSSAHADYHPHHLAWRRGVSVVTHVADIGLPFGPVVISAANREALHVIDALCHHETDLNIEEHYTDEGGSTFHVFALCGLLGFRFAPNLRDMDEQILYTTRHTSLPPPLAYLQRASVRDRWIEREWDEVLRLAASIRHGAVSAALLMRKLAAYPRQNRVSQALNEMGKLERTPFILNFLRDETVRRRVRVGLNRHEAFHSLAKALFIGQEGEFRDRALEDQLHRASCLVLLIAAISAWNTVYLQKAIDALLSLGIDLPHDILLHITPLGWEHINLLGRYEFDLRQARPLDNLRDLRLRGLLLQPPLEE